MVYRIRDRVEFDAATTETTLYVDIVAGSDGYDGTVGSPLKTIQEAVYRHIPPYAPAPYWSSSVVKRIIVKYTSGMPILQENVIKPPHTGAGLFIIEGEMHVESNLVQSGATTTVAGYQGRNRVAFTTSPLTPSSLDGYFAEPVPDVIFGSTELFSYLEHFCIIDNAAGSIDLAAGKIGSVDGFGYGDTSVIRIVRPQINWAQPDLDPTDIGAYTSAFINQGGTTLIKGFIYTPTNLFDSFITSDGAKPIFIGGFATYIDQCTLIEPHYFSGKVNSLLINSCYIQSADSSNGAFRFYSGDTVHMERCHAQLTQSEVNFDQLQQARARFCYFERISGISTHIRYVNCPATTLQNCDFRGGVNLQLHAAGGSAQNCTFEGVLNPAIEILERADISLTGCTGATGNTKWGVLVGESSYVKDLSGNTVTGSLGDLRIGGAPTITWGEIPFSDAVTFSRIE